MTRKEHYAFPVVVNDNIDYFHGGLTKREYFAAMRRVESISPQDAKLLMGKDAPEYGTIEYLQYHIEATEKMALIAADALIKVLNEIQP